jgi:hypothetical protein
MTDPTIGVWISEDGEVGAPDPVNLYRIEGNNPVNSVDPSGLAAIKSLHISFNGFDSDQRRQLVEYTWAAITKLEKALSMLTDHWDELEDLATVKSVPKPFPDETYKTLRRTIIDSSAIGAPVGCALRGQEVAVRQKYIRTIKSIFSQIKNGDTIEFKEVGKRQNDHETVAYISYFFSPHGEVIRITPLYWDLPTKTMQVDKIIRELGRREGFDQTDTKNPLYDAQYWENTISYLARKYDELMAKKNNP